MENFIVTFARGFGTGGKEIASMLAKDLGIHCYENRILTLASQMSGLDEKLFLDINERIRNNGGFTGFLAMYCPDPGSTLQEMRNLFPMTGCLSISHRSSETWQIRNPA